MFSEKPKYARKMIAVDIKSDLNKKNKQLYEIFKNDNCDYCIVISKKLDGYKLYTSILNKFNQKDKEVDVDLDSFLSIITDPRYIQRLLMSLVAAFNYASSIPFTMKTIAPKALRVNFFGDSISKYKNELDEYQVVAQAQTFVRKLQDMPSNMMYPKSFVELVTEHIKNDNIKITVLEKKELEQKKMFSLLGVGQAATEEHTTSRMMVIEYNGNPTSKEKRAYVGKGVCFDTGGYNIKTASHMRWMKYDMSGAAIVAGTVHALAKNKIKTNVVAVCPLVVNLLGEKAQKPDDIVTSYLGKTIEIDNTDAEGRLILVDAITYASKDLNATKIYDVATLTGAMIYSLGETYTGTWATDSIMWQETLEGAKQAGEQVWRLPFHSEFTDMMKSTIADIVNSVSSPTAGSSRAACFLKEFTMDKPYVHFDVAATADKNHTGTGIILRTLYNIAKHTN